MLPQNQWPNFSIGTPHLRTRRVLHGLLMLVFEATLICFFALASSECFDPTSPGVTGWGQPTPDVSVGETLSELLPMEVGNELRRKLLKEPQFGP